MAIQVNKRKRKHETANDGLADDGDIAVPKKLAKESQTPKKSDKKGYGKIEQMHEEQVLSTNGTPKKCVKASEQQQVSTGAVATSDSSKKKAKKAKAEAKLEQQDELANETETSDPPKKKSKKIQRVTHEEQTSPSACETQETPEKIKKKRNKNGVAADDKPQTMGLEHTEHSTEQTKVDNSEHVEEADSGIEPEEQHIRFPNDFKMMNFRTKLRGNNFITELRHFLYMCNVRPKIVSKYIEKRGKPLELAEAFERVDKSNVLHLGYLCEALQRVIMEIVGNQKHHMESAVSGCRYFLKVHGAVMEQLLQSPKPQHRRNALKLLTAIVCVEPQLGRQVLNSYDILSNVKTMEDMLSHSKFDFKDDETVRKAYIHFVLAFLVDGNTLLIRNILDKNQLISVLAKGLVYDDHVTVCVVLNTLRQYVLENAEISKTKKIHVFDLECCKHFRRLYDWQGPKALAKSYTREKHMPASALLKLAAPEEREAVAAAVHELLLVLLTSRKYGITFDAMTNYRQKHNKLQGKLLGSLYRPFADARKTALVIETLTACPDLARHTVRNFAGLINPARTLPNDLPAAADFLARIIAAVPPSVLGPAMNQMTLTDFGYWIKEVCLPVESLLYITNKYQLKDKRFELRMAVNRLLLSMMQQYSNYMSAIARREQSKHAGNTLRRFKFDLLNHLLVHYPPVESILYSLFLSIQSKDEPNVNVLEHLSVTLDLILLMCKENRAFVNKTSQIVDYLDVLRPLYVTDFDELQQQGDNQEINQLARVTNIKLELKSIKTILLLFPRALQPEEQLFEKVLRSFVKAYLLDDFEVRTEAGELLHRLFQNTGLFDGCSYEVDLWLEALQGFDMATVDNVVSILLTIFQLNISQVQLPAIELAETATNVKNLRNLFEQIEQGHTVQAYVETLMMSKLLPLIFQGVDIAPPYDAYVELVCVLLYHHHTKPEYVQQLYAANLNTHNAYMLSWLPSAQGQKRQAQSLPTAIAKHWPLLDKLQQALLGNSQSFDQIFKPDKNASEHFELKLPEGQTVQLDCSLRYLQRNMAYVHQVLFVLAQLVATQQLLGEQAELAASYLIRMLQIAAQLDGDKSELTDSDAEQQTHLQRLLHYIYGIRLSQLRVTQLFKETSPTQLNYVKFLRQLTEHCRQLPKFSSYSGNYRLQLIKALELGLSLPAEAREKLDGAQILECVALVEAFEMSAQECVQMLELLTLKLQAADYFVAGKPTHYYELLLRLLRRLAMLREPVDCSAPMEQLRCYYREYCLGSLAQTVSEQQLEQFEAALYDFLQSYHHHIADCDGEFFVCFFVANRKLSKSAVRLASLLLQRNAALAQQFRTLLPEHLEQKELIYPLLDVALSSGYELELGLLQRCYQSYKNGFMKSIEKPQKAALIYREHAAASVALIAKCMPKSECLDYCQKQLKFDAVELYQMRVLREIYRQAFASAKDAKQQALVYVSYLNLNVQMLAFDLKKQNVELPKLEQLAYNCYDWWQQPRSDELLAQLDWSRLVNAPQWLNFCKSSLKLGMSMPNEQTTELDYSNGLLLKLLAFLCDQFYADYSEEQQPTDDGTPALLYEMVCTHSCCYDHLLNYSPTPTNVKTHLLQLLETLARKAPQALQQSHIPILLGAYQARLTQADRYTLALLEHYERFDVDLAAYRPFIWGESAVAFYALRATDDERAKLQQQETSVAQALALIVRQTCNYTIDNYPVWRGLHASEQLPELQFLDPSKKSQRFGANALEQQVEQGQTDFTQDVRRLCPKREQIYEGCYDPAFMVPLMLHCFAPESVVRALWPVQNGLLALSFCALSSLDKDMRLAAACCQQRYRGHFEQSKFYERPLWTQAYENIQAGLSELRDSWLAQRRTHGGNPRVPLIPALFIARTFNLSTEPTHLLYKRLMLYLRLKQSFNFQTIPEFNVLFYSQEVEHEQYREFIVELLRCGIKCSADLFLLVSTNTFKVLLSFFGCSIATLDMNLLILSVLSSCVKIPGAAKIMLEHVGILPWLLAVIRDTEFFQFDIIEGVISIVNNLWYAVAASRAELPEYEHVQLQMQRVVLRLLPLLSSRISVEGLARILNVLQKTASASAQHVALPEQQLDQLLECAARHWPTQLAGIRYVRSFGGACASSQAEYCRWLANEEQLDLNGVLALSSLRAYVSDWWQAQSKLKADTHKLTAESRQPDEANQMLKEAAETLSS